MIKRFSDIIPVSRPLLGEEEKIMLMQCLETGWISSEGPFVKEFEERFAQNVDRKFGVTVANGTAALEIAVTALGIKEGDEVITPTFSIISTVAAITKVGAVPVFVDSDPYTWNMDISSIEEKINSKTKAILIVHMYGLPADINPILKLANKYNLRVIEDAAQMHGQTYFGKPCGSFGDISTFSFYSNKNITTGEGGMVVTNDPDIADKCKSLRNLCFLPEKRFFHHEIGWNYRMTNLQAAMGLAQLSRIDKIVARKKYIGDLYNSIFTGKLPIQLPLAKTDYATNLYWVYGIVLEDGFGYDNTKVMAELAKENIVTRPFFWCMHEQPVYNKLGMFIGQEFPVAENLARKGFYLPSGLGNTDEEIIYSAEMLIKVLTKGR